MPYILSECLIQKLFLSLVSSLEKCFLTCYQVQAAPGVEPKMRLYDADHERRRKEQLIKLFNRTEEQVSADGSKLCPKAVKSRWLRTES